MDTICPLNPEEETCLAVQVGSTRPGGGEELHPMLGNIKTDGGQRKSPAVAKRKSETVMLHEGEERGILCVHCKSSELSNIHLVYQTHLIQED